jgi:hypothetical protein
MDTGITLILALIFAVAAGGVVWFLLRKNLPPGASYDIGLAAAYVRGLLGKAVTEAEVRVLATWAYDNLKLGSQYYDKDAFVTEVTRIIMHALQNEASVASLVQGDGALAVTLKQARDIPNKPAPNVQRLT